jgi:hypothetical protein
MRQKGRIQQEYSSESEIQYFSPQSDISEAALADSVIE